MMSRMLALIVWGAAAGAVSAVVPSYVVIDIGTLPGSAFVYVSGLNNNGAAVGSCSSSDGSWRAWVWSAGQMVELPTLGGNFTKAYAINDNGWIVGEAKRAGGGASHAVLWRPGQPPQDLGTLGGSASFAKSINNAGEIVGRSDVPLNQGAHAYLWRNGLMVDMGTLPGGVSNRYSIANMINNLGQVVGWSDGTDGNPNPFAWAGRLTGAPMINLAPQTISGDAIGINDVGAVVGIMHYGQLDQATRFPNADGSGASIYLGRFSNDTEGAAHAINNSGVIVGNSARAGFSRAVIWTNGTPSSLTDLNTLIPSGSGWQLQNARLINNAGQIVGSGQRNGLTRVFFLTSACRADLDNGSGTGTPDGGVGIEDLLYFLTIYTAGAAAADLDDGSGNGVPDGGVGIEDLLYYIRRYDQGC